MTSAEGVAAAATPSAGSGRILDNTLLVSSLPPGTFDDVARDTLLIAQREAPTAKTATSWVDSVLQVVTQLGWTCGQVSSNSLTFGESKLPWHKPSTTIPWESMRTQLDGLLSGPTTIDAVDAYVAELAELSEGDRARWDKSTVLGPVAVCVVAVVVPASDGLGLALSAAVLTYDSAEERPTLTGFPDRPVPAKGATLTLTDATYYLSGETAASVRDQLNDVVSAVLPSIITVPPTS